MTDGRGLAFLNKSQALHCEGFHCKGSSAFIDSQRRCAARWGKVLGQADHSWPVQESPAYTHPCKLDEMWETWPGIVHGQQCHRSPPPHPLSLQLSYVELGSGRQAGDRAWYVQKNEVLWDRKSEFGALLLRLGITSGLERRQCISTGIVWKLLPRYLIDTLTSALWCR